MAIVTKIDLAAAVEFDAAAAQRRIQAVRPGMETFEISSKTGQGMDRWLGFLQRRRTLTAASAIVKLQKEEKEQKQD